MLGHQERPGERRHFVHGKILKLGRVAISTLVPGGSAALGILDVARRRGGGSVRAEPARQLKFGNGGGVVENVIRALPTRIVKAIPCPPSRSGAARFRDAGGNCRTQASVPCPPGKRGEPRTRNATGACVAIGAPAMRGITAERGGRCVWPMERNAVGDCVPPFLGSQPGPDPGRPADVNGVVPHTPQTHPPVVAEQIGQLRLRCPAGYVLGRDNNCWWNLPRNSKWRKWKPGRKPMFTGGDLNAIARAGKLADSAEEIFKNTNPAKKAVARNYRANWRKPLKK